MFRVHYFQEMPGGFTDTKIIYDLGDGINEEKKFFLKRENADYYLNIAKMVYVNHVFCAFVRTSKRLIEMGDRQIYRTKKKIDAMVKCLDLMERIKGMKLLDICIEIVGLEAELEALIPVEASPSHQMSYFQVRHLMRFAKKEAHMENRIGGHVKKRELVLDEAS